MKHLNLNLAFIILLAGNITFLQSQSQKDSKIVVSENNVFKVCKPKIRDSQAVFISRLSDSCDVIYILILEVYRTYVLYSGWSEIDGFHN